MAFQGAKVVYVTRDIERALGMTPSPNYLIISNKTPHGEDIARQHPGRVILVGGRAEKLLGTGELLGTAEARSLMAEQAVHGAGGASVLVFKNTLRVESVIRAHGWNVLNPPSDLSERVENKLSQLRWLGSLGAKYLPSHASKVAKYITWKADPFIIQWAHGHTGDGTVLVRTPEELRILQDKFPDRMARVSAYVEGPSYTVNAVITPSRILIGNLSYQITGLSPFTDNAMSTVGNDWGLAGRELKAGDLSAIRSMVEEIGRKLQSDGWKGLFGVDLIREAGSNRIYLIEVNARQPASATFESSLQEAARSRGSRGLTTFEAHIRALLGLPIDEDIVRIDDGAQIVQRVTRNVQSLFDDAGGELERGGYKAVTYENSAPNSDLLRIQSRESIMAGHNIFNDRGREIAKAIKDSFFKIQL
ncbi:MAG: hypothetical protein QOG91_343 [Candidatus Parcubacteria bacterium]|jgi:hypothetical protein|nr:hypothetical protein [Candidatus Parcubacteria bacterium]